MVPQRGLDEAAVGHLEAGHRPVPQPLPQPHPANHGTDRLHAHPRLHGAAVPREGALLGPFRGQVLKHVNGLFTNECCLTVEREKVGAQVDRLVDARVGVCNV